MEIKIEKARNPKPKPQNDKLGFSKYFTDHMFIMDYAEGTGWHSPRIVPYQPLELDPASAVFHYGQAVFEGLKAYRTADNRILLFRPEKNMERLNATNERLCIPNIDQELVLKAIKTLVDLDRDWVPKAPGTSLYIRPFILAVDPDLVVKASRNYVLVIILSPVGAYYSEGINPVDIYVEPEYVRAVRGGTGQAKFAGNYAASLKAQQEAAQHGCAQVLWLDGIERKYVEEVGSMNVFFRMGDEVVTPPLEGSILPGVTRDSVISLLDSWGFQVAERKIAIEELCRSSREGTLQEAFGTGTAAVISPIGALYWNNERILVGSGGTGELSKRLYDTLTGIQTGQLPDTFHWTQMV